MLSKHHLKLLLFFLVSRIYVNAIDVDTTLQRFDYDLGTTSSPVKNNFVQITPETTGDISWSSKPSSADVGDVSGVNDLTRDFVYSRNEITLSHKLANGDWVVTLIMGDGREGSSAVHDNMSVLAEGDSLFKNVSNEAGQFPVLNGNVTVTDGELNLTFNDNGGSTPHWVCNRLTISKKPAPGTTGTLRHPNGEIIRAAPMTWNKTYPQPVAYAKNRNSWYAFKDFHYNAIRLTWGGSRKSSNPDLDTWTWPELLAELDSVVATAVACNMCLIVNYHYVGEQGSQNPNGPDFEMNFLEEFWTQVAPRYNGNDLVVYELQNEPSFSKNTMLSNEYRTGFLRVYNKVRELAPDQQIIVFSSPHHTYIDELIEAYENDLDWDYTIGGYHLYNGGKSTSVQEAASRHRVICTEWDYSIEQHSYVRPVDGYDECSETLERIGQGWMDWSTHRGPVFSHSLLIPDAIAKGYQWWPETGTTITWDRPTSDGMYYENNDMPIKITVTDDGSIDYCNLFIDGYLVSKDSIAPFEWNEGVLKDMKAGYYTARIEAVDNEGHIQASTRIFSVLPGTEEQIQVMKPSEDAYVRNNGTQDGSGNRLLSQHAHVSTNARKAFLKFDLSEVDKSSVGAARIRIYNTGEQDEGYMTLHEILNDNWSDEGITYSNCPKNTGIPGKTDVVHGGIANPDIRFSHRNEWIEYDVTGFVNQELKDDKIITIELGNKYECQDRFKHSHETDLLFSFASSESDRSPQLILAQVGVADTAKVKGVKISSENLILTVGETYTLSAILDPVEAANKNVNWESNNTGVVTIDANGTITAIAEGSATIKVTTTDGGFTSECKVTVTAENKKISAKPVAYWDFDETSGGTVHDRIGSAHGVWQNGTSNGLGWSSGIIGGAAHFSGGSKDKFIVDANPLEGCTELTISFWFNMDATAQYEGLVVTRDMNNNGSKNWGISAEGTHIDARWDGNAIDSKSSLTVGKWHHIAMTWKNTGERKLYFDGELDTENTCDKTSYNGVAQWWFGDDPCCDGREPKAFLDDLAMFDKALTADDIAHIYSKGSMNKPLSSIYPGGTGNKNLKLMKGFDLYPNPTAGQINVSLHLTENGLVNARIFNINGKVIHQSQLGQGVVGENQYELNPGLTPGVYMVEITAGTNRMVKKLIVE